VNTYNVPLRSHHKTLRQGEIMAQPGDLSWGAPGWNSQDQPVVEGFYVIHYAWEPEGPEFIGIDYFTEGRWGRRWTEYPRFEWCGL